MSRVQLALRVADLDAAVDFYSKLFDAAPAKRRPGYANFAIAEPPIKPVLLEGAPGEPTRMDRLGVEVATTANVAAASARLATEEAGDCDRGGHRLLLRRPGQGSGHRPRRRAVGGLRRQGRLRHPGRRRHPGPACAIRRPGFHALTVAGPTSRQSSSPANTPTDQGRLPDGPW